MRIEQKTKQSLRAEQKKLVEQIRVTGEWVRSSRPSPVRHETPAGRFFGDVGLISSGQLSGQTGLILWKTEIATNRRRLLQ
jgi:hypothetical protein